MPQLIVKAKKLNKRKYVPAFFPDPDGIAGFVKETFEFQGEEVAIVPNPDLGKWYKDRDNCYYWAGGLNVIDEPVDEKALAFASPDNSVLANIAMITPVIKKKITDVVNAFESGVAAGNYAALTKAADHRDPETNQMMVQVSFGRSQTTEFSNLKALVQDYVNSNGKFADTLRPYLDKIGKKPSLATDDIFCNALVNAGKTDPIMKTCQDDLFESGYYQRGLLWFNQNGFKLPLSLLVVYDSMIHSGTIFSFLRNKFTTVVPASGGNEKEWMNNYIDARQTWLSSRADLAKTIYRTKCLKEQSVNDNWDLSRPINAHGVIVK